MTATVTRVCVDCGTTRPLTQFPLKNPQGTRRHGRCTTCLTARERSCTSKTRYTTQEDAAAAGARSARRVWRIRLYACPFCEGWHLTKTRKRR